MSLHVKTFVKTRFNHSIPRWHPHGWHEMQGKGNPRLEYYWRTSYTDRLPTDEELYWALLSWSILPGMAVVIGLTGLGFYLGFGLLAVGVGAIPLAALAFAGSYWYTVWYTDPPYYHVFPDPWDDIVAAPIMIWALVLCVLSLIRWLLKQPFRGLAVFAV